METATTMAIIMTTAIISASTSIAVIASSGLRGIARNPEAGSDIQTNLILSLAFAEAIAIYGLVVTLVLKFA
ncbi:MAG: hypothetical protein GF381_04270 [Candidatus Pacebacteria bacterium]|nr:hypothetical protein [Candidatus Paceibacterota bacterium]